MEDFYRAENPQQPEAFTSIISCAFEPLAARAAQRLKLVSKTTSKRINSCLRRRRRERIRAQEEEGYWHPAHFEHDYVFGVKGRLAFGYEADANAYAYEMGGDTAVIKYLSDDFEYAGVEADTGGEMYLLKSWKRL